jgi:hypothetical protein
MDVTKKLIDSLNGVQKSPRQRALEEALARIEADYPSRATKAAHEALKAPLLRKTADQRAAEAIEARKAHSEPQQVYENTRLPFDARPPSSELGLLP